MNYSTNDGFLIRDIFFKCRISIDFFYWQLFLNTVCIKVDLSAHMFFVTQIPCNIFISLRPQLFQDFIQERVLMQALHENLNVRVQSASGLLRFNACKSSLGSREDATFGQAASAARCFRSLASQRCADAALSGKCGG